MEKLISHVLLKDQLFFESHRENAFGFFFFLNRIVSSCCQKSEVFQLQSKKSLHAFYKTHPNLSFRSVEHENGQKAKINKHEKLFYFCLSKL